MSVVKSQTGNSLYDYFSNLAEFENMKKNLIREDLDGFIRWFDKLRIIDPRTTWIFLQRFRKIITDEQREYVEATYNKSLFTNKRKDDEQ